MKKVIKILSAALIVLSLSSTKVNAEQWHWVNYTDWNGNLITWLLVNENGGDHSPGWYYENGEWYYVFGQGLICRNTKCEKIESSTGYDVYHYGTSDDLTLEGSNTGYYFDQYGHMLHDCYVYFAQY